MSLAGTAGGSKGEEVVPEKEGGKPEKEGEKPEEEGGKPEEEGGKPEGDNSAGQFKTSLLMLALGTMLAIIGY